MRSALAVWLAAAALVAAATPGRADPAAGQAVFETKECATCHYTEGPAREKTIEDQVFYLCCTDRTLQCAGNKFTTGTHKRNIHFLHTLLFRQEVLFCLSTQVCQQMPSFRIKLARTSA